MLKFSLAALLGSCLAAQAQTPPYTHRVRAEVVYNFTDGMMALYPGGNQLFVTNGTSSVKNIWVSTGTPGNATRLATGFVAGPTLQNVALWKGLTQVGGSWCFNPQQRFPAGTSSFDTELWLTNGTVAGTRMLDLWPNTATRANSADPSCFLEFNGRVVFNANRASASFSSDYTLHHTTGTLAGTLPVALTAVGRVTLNNGAVNMQDTVLYFNGRATLGGNNGLFRLRRNFVASQVAPFIFSNEMVRLGNKILFWGERSDTDNLGTELYVSDGTTAGTRLLKDIVPGPLSPNVVDQHGGGSTRTTTRGLDQSIQVWNNKAFFICAVQQAGTAVQSTLWATDGTPAGTTAIYTSPSYMGRVHTTPNGILFIADDASNGNEATMFRSNGTAAGTGPLVGPQGQKFYFNDGSYGGHCNDAAGNFYASGRYFNAAGTRSDTGLLISDGTGAGTRVTDVRAPGVTLYPLSAPSDLTVLNGYFYFLDYTSPLLYRFRLADVALSTAASAQARPLGIYPNPSGNSADVRLQLPATTGPRLVQATVEDLCGRQVKRQALTVVASGETTLPTADLAPGVYCVRVQTDAGIFTGRLVR